MGSLETSRVPVPFVPRVDSTGVLGSDTSSTHRHCLYGFESLLNNGPYVHIIVGESHIAKTARQEGQTGS